MKNKLNLRATSIIEAMVVMMIIVSGVTGMYNIMSKSNHLVNSVKNKITAIQIARQGIEAFTNIRDTNSLLYSSDLENCWNTIDYNNCIGNDLNDIKNNGKYKIIKKTNNRWYLEEGTLSNNFSNSSYRDFYKVGLDINGIYTQTGIVEELKPIFTRELDVSYPTGNSNDYRITVKSIVYWVDDASTNPHKVEFEQTLTNWKSKR